MHKVEVIPVIVRAWGAIPNSFFTVPHRNHFLKKRMLLLKCFCEFQEATTVNSALSICCRIKSFQESPGKIFNNLPIITPEFVRHLFETFSQGSKFSSAVSFPILQSIHSREKKYTSNAPPSHKKQC